MSAQRVIVGLAGATFFAFGVGFLLWPATLAAMVSIPLELPAARTEFRAVYGGMEIGLGAFLLVCAAVRSWVMPGLVAATLTFAGLSLGRFYGLVVDGFAQPMGLAMLAAEAMAMALAGSFLFRNRAAAKASAEAPPA